MYPSLAAWNADAAVLETKIKELSACRGHLGDSAQRFKSCLDLSSDIDRIYSRLGTFSGEQLAENTGVPAS